MDANRISSRYSFESRFRISSQRNGEKLVFEGWARDLSESGLGAFVGQSLELGEVVMLDIPVAGGDNIAVEAEVVRCLGTEYGFQFITLSPAQRLRILDAVKDKTKLLN